MYRQIIPFAKAQLGLVTRDQLRTFMTPDRIKHEASLGRLEAVRRGVYRLAGSPESWEQMVLAACLACRDAVVSFVTAAVLWYVPGLERDGIELTVPRVQRIVLDGVTVHQTTVWGPHHHGMRGAVPVTSMARTLCDLSSHLGPGRLGFAVDDAIRRKVMTLRQYEAVAAELDGQGRKRCTTTRKVLEERTAGYQPGDSHPERRLANVLVDAGLPMPTLGHRVQIRGRTFRLDLAYPQIRFAFEYDSQPFHDHTTAFFADRERDALLDEIEWTVKRVTKKTSDAQVVGMARRAHERAGLALPPREDPRVR
jgi:hypothetical protein